MMGNNRQMYIDMMYEKMNALNGSKPIFVYSPEIERIISDTKEEDNILTIIFSEYDQEEKSYNIVYDMINIEADQMIIEDMDDHFNIMLGTFDSTVASLELNILQNQFITLEKVENEEIYEIKIYDVPPWYMVKTNKVIMDILPIIYTDEKVEVVNNNLYTVTRIWAYLPGQFKKFLFDIITTPLKLDDHGMHDSRVNLTKAKIKNSDLNVLCKGSVIAVTTHINPSTFYTDLFEIEELGDEFITCYNISNSTEEYSDDKSTKIRYKYLLEDNVSIIPFFETILRQSAYRDKSPILKGSSEYTSRKLTATCLNDLNLYIDHISNANISLLNIEEDKINELIQKKATGKRIDKNRNKTVQYIKDTIKIIKLAMESVESICGIVGEDYTLIYNDVNNHIEMHRKDDNIFSNEYEKLCEVLDYIGVKME